jgi:hypothetical protein
MKDSENTGIPGSLRLEHCLNHFTTAFVEA